MIMMMTSVIEGGYMPEIFKHLWLKRSETEKKEWKKQKTKNDRDNFYRGFSINFMLICIVCVSIIVAVVCLQLSLWEQNKKVVVEGKTKNDHKTDLNFSYD